MPSSAEHSSDHFSPSFVAITPIASVYGDPLTIGELIEAGVARAEWVCRDYDCMRRCG